MVASIKSPADIVNYSLRRIGNKNRVGNLYDGSNESSVALDVFTQVRDEFLRQSGAGFCERNAVGTVLKYAPEGGYFPPNTWDPTVNPPLPWFYEYAYPDDCIEVRALRQQALFVLDFDPQPITFSVENDNYYTPARRVILCNIANATIVYTGQVTDLSTWDSGAIEAFAAALGRRLAPALMGLDAAKLAVQDEAMETQLAAAEEG